MFKKMKTRRVTQTRKANSRKRAKIVLENQIILREGREAFEKLNERLAAERTGSV